MSYQELVKAAEAYLESQAGISLSGRKIAEHLEAAMKEGKIDTHPRDVIYSYLSRAANHDEVSRIVSGGPHGGYSVEKAQEDVAKDETQPENEVPQASQTKFQARESHLYALIKLWLESSDYVSADVSNLKAGGQWGNPDLIGVSRVEILGTSEIELVSVEAKLSETNWERFIFEAISHKRFANRSWFCYRTSTPYPALPKNMAYYAERYKVGILQLHLADEEIEKVASNLKASAEYLDRVQERVRALYEPVPLQEKSAFLARAGMALNLNVSHNL